jgi:hypothetical protein
MNRLNSRGPGTCRIEQPGDHEHRKDEERQPERSLAVRPSPQVPGRQDRRRPKQDDKDEKPYPACSTCREVLRCRPPGPGATIWKESG